MAAYRTLMTVWRAGVPGLALAIVLALALASCQSGNSTTPAAQSNTTPTSASTPGAPSNGSGTPAPTPGAKPTTSTAQPASTWAQLEQRPLLLPHLAPGAACPVTPTEPGISPDFGAGVGSGPVYVFGMTNGVLSYGSAREAGDPTNPWGLAKVYWQIKPAYGGLVLIRGQQVDGSHALRFNGGLDFAPTNTQGTEPLLNELHLKGGNATPPSWPTWATYIRVEAPGCYAYQVDGGTFTEVIVFQARSI